MSLSGQSGIINLKWKASMPGKYRALLLQPEGYILERIQ
jgi:hypothetical protein